MGCQVWCKAWVQGLGGGARKCFWDFLSRAGSLPSPAPGWAGVSYCVGDSETVTTAISGPRPDCRGGAGHSDGGDTDALLDLENVFPPPSRLEPVTYLSKAFLDSSKRS